jgi:hypothetical protein
MVKILDHKYTKASLSFETLKSTDLALYNLLKKIKGLKLFLGQFTINESGNTHLW